MLSRGPFHGPARGMAPRYLTRPFREKLFGYAFVVDWNGPDDSGVANFDASGADPLNKQVPMRRTT